MSATRALAVTAVLVILLSSPAHAGPWTFGLGGAATGSYTYRPAQVYQLGGTPLRTGDQTFQQVGLLASVGANRRMGSRWSIQSNVDYCQSGSGISVQMSSLSLGVRRDLAEVGPYVEVLPGLYGARWTDESTDYSSTSLRPGITFGAGIHGPLGGAMGLEFGVGYRVTTDWPAVRQRSWYATNDYQGLRQMTVGAKLLVTP